MLKILYLTVKFIVSYFCRLAKSGREPNAPGYIRPCVCVVAQDTAMSAQHVSLIVLTSP
jgi:hypothetical protein